MGDKSFRADWAAEGCNVSSFDGWESDEDWETDGPLIFSDGLDFEERRVDLPCDDDGRVFLAPHREPEDGCDDDSGPQSNELDIAAKKVSFEDGDLTEPEPPQRDFGFKKDDFPERQNGKQTIEPPLDSPADLPFRRGAITDAFISLKASTDPVSQDQEFSDAADEIGGLGEQLSLPESRDWIGADASNDSHQAIGEATTVPIKATAFSFVRPAISRLQAACLGLAMSAARIGAGLRPAMTTVSQILRVAAEWGAGFSIVLAAGVRIAASALCRQAVRMSRSSAAGVSTASLWLGGMISRLMREFGSKTITLAAASRVRISAWLRVFRPWLSTFIKDRFNDAKKLMSISKRALGVSAAVSVRSSKSLMQRTAHASTLLAVVLRQAVQAAAAAGHIALTGSLTTFRKGARISKHASGRAWAFIRQKLSRQTSYIAQGILSIMKTVQKNMAVAGSLFKRSIPTPLAGMAGAAAAVLLLAAAVDDTPKSKGPSIVLDFPPKPVEVERTRTDEPIIFDWPAIDVRPSRPDPSGPTDTSRAEPAPEEDPLPLSPEAALAGLIAATDPAALSPIAVSVAGARTSILEPERAWARPRSEPAVRLAALTLLADIEAIANAEHFTKALRAVGLETLIKPGQSYTMLVPNDAAFAKLGNDELQKLLHPSGHHRLRSLLSNHILEDRLRFDDFAGENRSYLSLANQPITIAATDVIKVEHASMIETDLRAANTVVHMIDDILVLGSQPIDTLSPTALPGETASDT